MMQPPRSAIWMLGAGQCVYWGVLYYAYAILLVPMREAFGVSEAVVAGAFSIGLGVSALCAPLVGRQLDRGRGVAMLRWGACAVAALLILWSFANSVIAVYAVWLGLGACMAMVLYEAAFALLTRAIDDAAARMRAFASVTVLGGLASTVFVPLVGIGAATLGWRETLRVLAVAWLVTAWLLERHALPALRERAERHAVASWSAPAPAPQAALVRRLGTPFVATSFAAMALTTMAVPMLVDRGHPLAAAAWVMAGFGVMQLPGRIWLLRGGRGLSMRRLLTAPLLLQATGLGLLAVAGPMWIAFAGVALFGLGAGLQTLVRPWLAAQVAGVDAAGVVNGRIARWQGFARALGPFAAAGAYGLAGGTALFAALALAMLAICPGTAQLAAQIGADHT